MPKVGRLLTSWDTCQIIKDEVEYRRELAIGEGEEFDEDKAWQWAAEDGDLFEMEWDSLCEYLTELMDRWNPDGEWRCEVRNFGWRHLNGYKEFHAANGKTLLRKVLPDTDCTFKVYRYGYKGLAIDNAHHDAPCGGEWYYITKKAA